MCIRDRCIATGGGYNVVELTSVGDTFPGTGFFHDDTYGFPESLETYLILFFHEDTQIFLFLPLFKRFLSPGDSMTPDWVGTLGAYNVVAIAELNMQEVVGLFQSSQPKLSN